MPATTVTTPQARIPIGYALVNGAEVPVMISVDWMMIFESLVKRTGGIDGSGSFEQYVNQFGEQRDTPAVLEAIRAIDEIRSEMSSCRSEISEIRRLIEENHSEPISIDPIIARVQQIEDRLA